MKFLKESINTISKEAFIFIQKHPEFRDKIKEFEEYFEVKASLTDSEYLFDIISDIDSPSDYERKDDWGDGITRCLRADFGKPNIDEIEYIIEDGQLAVKGFMVWQGNGVHLSNWQPATYYEPGEWGSEYDVTVTATMGFTIIIADNVSDTDAYKFDYDIEYEEG